jgi:signal transduction histidine kinase
VLFVVMGLLVNASTVALGSERLKNVLVLYVDRPDLPAHHVFEHSMRSSLMASIATPIDVYSEYMDVSRFPSEEYLRSLHVFYRRKYTDRTMDLIVTVGLRPLEFLLLYQEELFPTTPVVFCSIDPDSLENLPVGPHITGIVRQLDFKGTLELALKLHPQTKRVVVFSGTTTTDEYYRTLARSQFRDYEGTVEFIDPGPLPMTELLERVARLPKDTIIFALTFFQDGAGRSFIPQQALSLVAQAANAPIYSVFETNLGYGAVGGHMHSFDALGAQTAEHAARILSGARPEDLPIRRAGTNAYLFDWRQLRRWGLREDRLPPGSIVRDKEPSIWAQYQGYIIGSGLLCTMPAMLIIGLLVQRRRRQLIEQLLDERLRFERLMADLSATFANLPVGDIDKYIIYALQQIAEFLGADRGNLTHLMGYSGARHVMHSWARDGFEPLPSKRLQGQLPWVTEQIVRGSVVQVAQLQALPMAAAADLETLRRMGSKSFVAVPLEVHGTILGTLSFATLRSERTWSNELVQRLRMLGEIFANALMRQQAEQASRESEALSSAVLASLEGLVAVIDKDGVIIAVNEAWSRFARDHHASPLASVSVGANYLDVCRRAWLAGDTSALEALIGIESVLKGYRAEFVPEYRCTTPDGDVWYVMSVEPLRRAEGGAVILHRDVTDWKRAEMTVQRHYRELAHMARVVMMGELAASLAHELNQPLTAILSNAQAALRFLAADPPDVDEVQAILADVVEDDQRAGEVIRRLRNLLRKGKVELLPLNLNQLTQEAVRLLHSDAIIRHIAIVVELDPDLPPVRGDCVQLQQVLLNLMLNGFEAMAERATDDRQMVVRTQRVDAKTIQVAVQDCGSGLDEDMLARIFEPFYSTKSEGMGMGLSLCQSILEIHGGRLWAANNLDRGATFYFSLPVYEEELEARSASSYPCSPPAGRVN